MGATLTTVVVNWNTVGLLDDCLASIVAATPDGMVNDIVLVDNASSDGSADHVAAQWPQVRVIRSATNEGFCRANNRAIRDSDSEFVLLVNTDARLQPGGIAALLQPFAADPQVAVVGPRLVYADRTFQRWTAGRIPTLTSMSAWLLGWDRLCGNTIRGVYLHRDDIAPVDVDWVSSAVMALRRSALDDIGLLDERIFVYMDDVDLCHRATRAGWRVRYAADTTAVHFMGASSRATAGGAAPQALRSLNRWFRRERGRTAYRALVGLEVAGFGLRALAHATRAATRDPEARAQALRRSRNHLVHLRHAMEPLDA